MSLHAGLSRMASPHFVAGATIAWDSGAVSALEVSLEHVFRAPEGADLALMERASASGMLLGHGVHYSVLSREWRSVDLDWLARVRGLAERWHFRWVTEHFGVVRAGSVWAAPLSIPYTASTLARGVERLQRLREAVEVPVGLENLALAWSAEDAVRQADFLDALLEPVDGLLLLDLHNLWCQAVNFGLDPVQLLERQPLGRVRQVHISGGSWSDLPEGRFRRDTHDGRVPPEVWALVPEAIARCPGLEVVTLERLGEAIDADPDSWEREVAGLVAAVGRPVATQPWNAPRRGGPLTGDPGAAWDGLFDRGGGDPEAIRACGGPWLEGADPRALATAAHLLARWGRPIPG